MPVLLQRLLYFFKKYTPIASYTDPYGESILSRCYWSVFFKKDTIKFWSTFTEKYGMPYLWGQTDIGSTVDNKEDLKYSLYRKS